MSDCRVCNDTGYYTACDECHARGGPGGAGCNDCPDMGNTTETPCYCNAWNKKENSYTTTEEVDKTFQTC